jgi:hypothetical protein
MGEKGVQSLNEKDERRKEKPQLILKKKAKFLPQ